MAGKAKAVPEGTHTVTAHLFVRGGDKAIEFYQKAFGAEVVGVHHTPDGKVMHAALQIGDSRVMLADEWPAFGSSSPRSLGGSPVVLNIYVEDVDALFNRAVAAGATVTMPLADMFWGDRYGQVVDPFGHKWALGKHIEDVAPDELERRATAMFADMGKAGHAGA